jgi:hypothetical protein
MIYYAETNNIGEDYLVSTKCHLSDKCYQPWATGDLII